jgi:hypothetical protein
MLEPNITRGQIAIDPINGVFFYKDTSNNLVKTTLSWLQENYTTISTTDVATFGSDVTITGNLTVNGDTVSVNVAQLLVEDNFLILNSNVSSAPSLNAGLEVERGTSTNVSIIWNESIDKWQFTNDGTTYSDLSSIIENSVVLGLHTTGDYIKNLVAGTGVTIFNNSGEGATPNISIGQSVDASATPSFARVIAPLTGNVTGDVTGNLTGNVTGNVTGNITGNVTGGVTGDVTGNLTGNVTGNITGNVTGNVTGTVSDISNHGISDLSDVNINNAADGNFLRYNGSNWFNDPVNLATDTIGDYVAKLAAGTGITITNNSGEGATPNIAFSGSIDNLSDVAITSAADGQILEFNGTNWVNSVRPSNEPMGHEDKSESTISFNEGTRTFSIAPVSTSFTVWCAGKRFVKTATETVQIPDTSGLYYIYYNSSGVLSYRTDYFVWDEDAPTAYVYWNEVDNKAYFFADERHGITLDWATHEYLHRTRGAAIANGFGANNYIINGNGSLDSHAKLDIANGTFFDEDLQVDISHSATPTPNTWEQVLQGNAEIPVFYRLNNHWTKDVATEFPLKQGASRPQYNLNTAGTWSATDIANNRFGVSWIIATNNLSEPIIAVLGQESYTDNGSAQAEFYSSLNLDGFPIVEFRPLYKIIYECKDSYTNTPSARITDVIDLRSIISSDQGVGATAVSDHGSMTGLTDDDHTQYLRTDGTRTATSLTVSGSITTNSFILDGIEIDAATPSDTNVLKYSSSLNKYIPGVASTVASLDDLTDVIITSATPNQILKWDGTQWVNAEVPGSIGGTTKFETIGDGSTTTFVISHNLTTRDVVVSITENTSPYGLINTSWEATTSNTITIYFETAPALNSVRVSIFAAVTGVEAGPTGPTGPSFESTFSYKVGDTGPGGGIIFFVDRFNEYSDFTYLEMAPDSTRVLRTWSQSTPSNYQTTSVTGASNAGLGSGSSNTAAIVAQGNSNSATCAATYCDSLTSGGQSDWYLGSIGEMKLASEVLLLLRDTSWYQGYYWSSTQADNDEAYYMQAIIAGSVSGNLKNSSIEVRAIRKFN